MLCQWMPLCSAACVGLSPHVDTCQRSQHDSAKKRNAPQPKTNSENVHVFGFTGATHTLKTIHKTPFQTPNLINPNYHLSYRSFMHLTHSKSSNNLSPKLFFHSVSVRSSLHSTPCRPTNCFQRPPGLGCSQHQRRRLRRGAAPRQRRGL